MQWREGLGQPWQGLQAAVRTVDLILRALGSYGWVPSRGFDLGVWGWITAPKMSTF